MLSLSSRGFVNAIGGEVEAGRGLPRAVEAALACLGLAAASPILLIAAGLVAMTSPGPVLFRQQRVGLNGRPFTLLKLRTNDPANPELDVLGVTTVSGNQTLEKTTANALKILEFVERTDVPGAPVTVFTDSDVGNAAATSASSTTATALPFRRTA